MSVDESRHARLRRRALFKAHLQMQQELHSEHYHKHVHKRRVYDSSFTGSRWMNSVLNSNTETRCVNAFRMERRVFHELCRDLTVKYGLQASKRMRIIEKVWIFVYTVAQGLTYRTVAERFQRSTATVSTVFHEVLDAIVGRKNEFNGMARDHIKPKDPLFGEVPKKIRDDSRYSVYFKGAIGCIDGTHINACIPEADQIPYRGRKGICTFNVMAVCDFDMTFTFVSAGWEGSAHDAKVFEHAISTPSMGFPHPPSGRYYLVDKGYPNKEGYMVPYSRTRYHLSQFENVAPTNSKEAFNKLHSSLRSCIERSFGVLKARWKILRVMPSYSVETQVDIILACFTLHNYVMRAQTESSTVDDLAQNMDFEEEDANEEQDVNNEGSSESDEEEEDLTTCGATRQIRDNIAAMLWSGL